MYESHDEIELQPDTAVLKHLPCRDKPTQTEGNEAKDTERHLQMEAMEANGLESSSVRRRSLSLIGFDAAANVGMFDVA